ncbi:MAG: COG4315 family predicted lipoprotein [Acidimicrobiales bacterium]
MFSSTAKLIIGVALGATTLSACHFSNGENGPAGAAPVVVPNSNGQATYGGGYKGTNASLLQAAPKGTHPTIDGGAGFKVPDYPTTTLPGWIQGHPPGPVTISYRNSPYGPILTTLSGKTIYVRLGDAYRISKCTGKCLAAFPPVLTNGAPQATGGLLPAYIGVLQTSQGGHEQIAYGQYPLYTYSGDTGPGQYHAEGKGGIWFVIGTDGVVRKAPLSATSPSTTAAPKG